MYATLDSAYSLMQTSKLLLLFFSHGIIFNILDSKQLCSIDK